MFVQSRQLKAGHRLAKNGRIIGRILDPNVDGYVEVEYTDGRTGMLRGSYDVTDVHRNSEAREGCDRCYCGCKYWEDDKCIDCRTSIFDLLGDPCWYADNREGD